MKTFAAVEVNTASRSIQFNLDNLLHCRQMFHIESNRVCKGAYCRGFQALSYDVIRCSVGLKLTFKLLVLATDIKQEAHCACEHGNSQEQLHQAPFRAPKIWSPRTPI